MLVPVLDLVWPSTPYRSILVPGIHCIAHCAHSAMPKCSIIHSMICLCNESFSKWYKLAMLVHYRNGFGLSLMSEKKTVFDQQENTKSENEQKEENLWLHTLSLWVACDCFRSLAHPLCLTAKRQCSGVRCHNGVVNHQVNHLMLHLLILRKDQEEKEENNDRGIMVKWGFSRGFNCSTNWRIWAAVWVVYVYYKLPNCLFTFVAMPTIHIIYNTSIRWLSKTRITIYRRFICQLLRDKATKAQAKVAIVRLLGSNGWFDGWMDG